MIIIKDTEIGSVIKTINAERAFLEGIKENLGMILNSSSEVYKEVIEYISRNATFNSIAEKAKKDISSKHDIIQTIEFGVDNGLMLLNLVEERLKKSNVKLFDTKTITYRQKGMFDWINSINFFTNYTSKIIDVSLTQPKTIGNYLTKADYEFLNKTAAYYTIVLKRLCDSERDIKRSIDMLSDETYDPDEVTVIEQLKGKEATSIGLAPHHFNPGYWVRYYMMTNDVKTIKSNREKIDMYAMKLQRLENKRNNTQDPSIDRQIEYWQNQIRVLDADIAEIEEKYSGNV